MVSERAKFGNFEKSCQIFKEQVLNKGTSVSGKRPKPFLPVETERRKALFLNKIGSFGFQNLHGVGNGNSRIGPY